MIANKHAPKIITALMAAAVIACLLAVGFSDKLSDRLGGSKVGMEYETALFDTDDIISIDILMDQDEWDRMLKNAISEEYYKCDVVINGEKFSNVAIRPKGNTSLSAIAMSDSDRYSFKLEFGHYVEGQTCHGLDKLILNNNYADATNMKEAIVYDMYKYLGADASLYNYANLSVNGDYYGVYLALEGVEQSFMLRNYGTQDGELYKPDNMEMGGGNEQRGGRREAQNSDSSREEANAAGKKEENGTADDTGSSGTENKDSKDGGRSKGGPGGGFGMGGSGGANLNYTDDELDSYSSIWESQITNTTDADHRRVVTALKNVSEGNDLDNYLDIDNLLKYMAVHTFAVNMDSLSGAMAHNYYLYEYDGRLNILPWDYNLSFGGMSMGGSDASELINDAIDTPFAGTEFFDSLLENDEYRERYHEYLRQLAEGYVKGGVFDESYTRIRSQIDPLVKTDPTAMYTYDEYQKAAEMLHKTVELRAESIEGQLDGKIPSTDKGQKKDSSSLVDASDIDVAVMGQFDMGGGGRSDMGSFDPNDMPEGFDPENMPEGGGPGGMSGGGSRPDMGSFNPNDLPEGFDPGNMPEGGGPDSIPDNGSFRPPGQGGPAQGPENGNDNNQPPSFSGMSGQQGGQPAGASAVKKLISFGICLLVMIAALIGAVLYKRRR